jgi:hypothetical protein
MHKAKGTFGSGKTQGTEDGCDRNQSVQKVQSEKRF